ncbi:hypothetical protein QQX09_11565 [Demequina sp. SYSU T00192]|uniref:Uncharacterized protein n=1 Tax=Demequina litoralis TaxID=3051660 RepID=A0ABT8GBH3_9MICO|nr:hypothetical protein [Demequina sp. SYSU T00192]MDN4476492.1 hypothetical protein [Demequina sp. SYSU T00192]
MTRRIAGVAAAVLAAAALTACGTALPDTELSDLTALGLESVPCEDTVQMAGIQSDDDQAVIECWTGAPDDGIIATADAVLEALLADNAGAEDVSAALCWDDTVTDAEASACRAILVGDTTDGAVVSAVLALKDPGAVIGELPDAPTDDEVEAALAGADVEVLVFSEPASSETGGA